MFFSLTTGIILGLAIKNYFANKKYHEFSEPKEKAKDKQTCLSARELRSQGKKHTKGVKVSGVKGGQKKRAGSCVKVDSEDGMAKRGRTKIRHVAKTCSKVSRLAKEKTPAKKPERKKAASKPCAKRKPKFDYLTK